MTLMGGGLTRTERKVALEVAAREGGETRKWLNLVLEAYDNVAFERGQLRLALRRLGSTESFTTALDLRPHGSSREAIVEELHARMQFAIGAAEAREISDGDPS